LSGFGFDVSINRTIHCGHLLLFAAYCLLFTIPACCAKFTSQSKFIFREFLIMPTIEATTATGQQTIEAPAGKKLVLVIEDAGIDILHRCGGNARCTTCRVEILAGEPGEMGELERNRLAMETELADNVRLSCQIHVNSDLSVKVVNQASVRGMDAGPRPLDE
jgi:ferredoxin